MLRRFHAIRVLRKGLPPRDSSRALVIYLNHASWWDPLVCLYLSREFFSERRSFAPIDTESLRKYAFFARIGFYGIEQHSTCGAVTFLRTTSAILDSTSNVVWLTPQARFMDARERPLRFQRGIGALALEAPEAVFLPLAIEYTFWTEPQPEILVSFGEATTPSRESRCGVDEWTMRFSRALESAQDELATRSCSRSHGDWLVIDKGACGIAPAYDAWRVLRARIRGKDFAREHQPAAGR